MSAPIDPRLLRAVPAVRRLLVAVGFWQFLGALLTIAQAVLLAEFIGSLFLPPHGGSLSKLALLATVAVGRAGVTAAQEWTTARASVRIRAELRAAVLTAVIRRGPGWAAAQPRGRVVTAAGTGLESLDGYLTRALPAMVASMVVPPLVLARIGFSDWLSLTIFVVVLPLIPLFMVLVGVTTRRRMERQYSALAAMSGHFLDLVQGLTTLKIYGQARRQRDTVRRVTESYRRRTMSTLRIAFLSGLVLDLIATLSLAVVAVDVGLRLDHGHIGLVAALTVLFLAPEVFAPLRAVGAQFHANEEGRAAVAAALDILTDEPGASSPSTPIQADGSLRLRRCTVRYDGRTDPALVGLDLDFAPGEVVAVQGPSGAGKSTLLSLLLGFTPHANGLTVGTADGRRRLDILNHDAWRHNLAWVPQRPSPTQADVAGEVALGDPDASSAQVQAAIAACHAPGPDVRLGEDGRLVSAGQRRRVALARALLRARRVIAEGGVPIVLLDEPSEDLDDANEAVVVALLTGLAGHATVLVATHSAVVAAAADRRIELANGCLVGDTWQRPVRGAILAAHPDPAPTSVISPDAPSVRPTRPSAALLPGWLRALALPALVSGAAGLCGLALTATSVWLICRAAEQPNLQALAIAVVGVRTFALARALLRYGERLISHDHALRMLAAVRVRVFDGLIPLAPSGLDRFRRGDLLRRFVNDVDAVQEGLVRAVVPTAGAAMTAIGAIAVVSLLSAPAGGVLALGLLVGIVVVPALTRTLAGPGAVVAELAGRRDAQVASTVGALPELVAFGATDVAVAGVADADRRVTRAARRPALGGALGSALAGVTAGLTLAGTLAVAVRAGSAGFVATGVIAACVLAVFDAAAPLPVAYSAWGRFRAAQHRVEDVVFQPHPIPDGHRRAPTGAPLGLAGSGILLSPAPEASAVLHDSAFALATGEQLALMGPSGCGKSTLLAAVLRLRALQHGRLEIEWACATVELVDLTEEELPPVAAGSLQGDHVFNASLRDNLRVVRPEATDDELYAAAAVAGLDDVVRALPQQWSTPAGADGGGLSGGQRQRLLLARAVLADPPILILDEPTAHLDDATEQRVLDAVLDPSGGRTVLLSTHRDVCAERATRVLRFRHRQLEPAHSHRPV